MISLEPRLAAAAPEDAEAAFAALDAAPGAYFGCDAGIAGLHPLQGTLLSVPAVALRVFADGVQAAALTAFGAGLLEAPALADWRARAGRGGQDAIAALRGFLAAFAPSREVLLLGALRFEAWKLAAKEPAAGELGIFYFPQEYLRRDAAGSWERVSFAEAADAAAAAVQDGAATAEPVEPADDYPPGGYAGMVAKAVGELRTQPLVSLTLSQSYRRRTPTSPAQGFARLRAANPAPASFFVNDGRGERLFGASPDLQLVVSGRHVEAFPVCGTVARGAGAVGEAESLRELFNEEVDAASLAVCSDALRNDLAPLCAPGSLHLADRRRPMALATVVHTVDRLAGELREGADAWDAIAATAAPVMLTGTPRRHALAAIGKLEASPRGWYGGMMVQVHANGDALAGTILRAAAVRDGIAEVRTGGDLMADSDPEREERESRLKSISLWRALGIEAVPPATAGAKQAARLPAHVRLLDGGDPFAAASRDALEALGLALSEDAPVTVATGDGFDAAATLGPVVAVADAAFRLLAHAGFDVVPSLPEQGRLQRCVPQPGAPWETKEFFTGRYQRHALRDGPNVPAGWEIWAVDGNGIAAIAANVREKKFGLMFRPDSLLSHPQSLQVLRDCIALAAG